MSHHVRPSCLAPRCPPRPIAYRVTHGFGQSLRRSWLNDCAAACHTDEFGEVGGFIGSDSLMMRPTSTRGGLFVSVGKEPKGVPPGVLHYRRGPAGFLEMLDAIAEVRQAAR